MRGFYWLIEGALAGCPRPGGGQRDTRRDAGRDQAPHSPESPANADDATAAALDADLAWLRTQGIGALLSLTETSLPEASLARHGLESLHLPVDDLTAPSPEQLDQALAFIDHGRARDRAVVVHCKVGEGRTGTVLAAYLIRAGRTVDQALADVRALRPGAVGVVAQEQALRAFARRRDWIV